MWDLKLRKIVAAVVDRIAAVIGHVLTANQLTVAALICGLAAAGFTAVGSYQLGVACWVLNRLLDGIDGPVARQFKQQSDFGGYIDIVSDFLVYALVPIALQPSCLTLLLASYFVNCVSLFKLAALLEARDSANECTSVRMPPALVEGAETIVTYTAALLFPHYSVSVTQNLLFSIFAAAVVLSAMQRLVWAYLHLT